MDKEDSIVLFKNLFKKKEATTKTINVSDIKQQSKSKVQPMRIGDIGEYKINIQLDQLPKECKYLSDVLIPNSKSKFGYSQIDHIVFTPYAVLDI